LTLRPMLAIPPPVMPNQYLN